MTSPKGHETDLIGREELKEKLERGDDFKLVMVLGEWEYRAKRIRAPYASAPHAKGFKRSTRTRR
jgi:hypothetical protein